MSSYLCGKCRSNDCIHIDPRLAMQLAQRYLNINKINPCFKEEIKDDKKVIYTFYKNLNENKKLLLIRK